VNEAELRAKLAQLKEEEQEVSTQRVKLHERLASFSNPVAEEQERELSVKRRELHAEIDRIRGLLGE
jgi:predicted  nucleic acid-binding Zn-ribbon protein